jgi:hypothetical protein
MARTKAYEKRFAAATVLPGQKWEYTNVVEFNQDNNCYT